MKPRYIKGIAEFVTKCPNCDEVSAKHQKPHVLLQEIQVPSWKWEDINMDFVVGLPQTQKQYDSILVTVDMVDQVRLFYSRQVYLFGGRLCNDLHR